MKRGVYVGLILTAEMVVVLLIIAIYYMTK